MHHRERFCIHQNGDVKLPKSDDHAQAKQELDVSAPELQRVRRAIVVVDVVESVRLIQINEDGFVRRWRQFTAEVQADILPINHGRIVKSLGDGLLMTFSDVPQSLAAVLALNARVNAYNQGLAADEHIRLRSGIHIADVLVSDEDIYSHGVNVTARLLSLAEPDDIILSGDSNDELNPKLDVETQDLGDCWLKHIEEPVRAFRVLRQQDRRPGPHTVPPDASLRPTVAVLPFTCEGLASNEVAMGDLIADELICALSTSAELQVVSRLSASVIAKRGGDPAIVGKALSADYVVTGSCRALGTQLLIHAQLVDAKTSEVAVFLRENSTVQSLIGAESRLLSSMASRLVSAMLERQTDLTRRSALPNLSGYTLLLGGINLMHKLQRKDFLRAREVLEHLCDRWPRVAAPLAWLARWHLFNVLQGWSEAPGVDRQAAFLRSSRALELDVESSIALAVRASIEIGLTRDVDSGIALYEQALRANPSDAHAWMLLGTAHAFKGDGERAVAASHQAQRLSPLDPLHFLLDCHAAGTELAAENYAQALTLAERSMRANALHLSTYRVLSIAQFLNGDPESARRTMVKLRTLDPGFSVEGYLKTSPSALYPIGKKFAEVFAEIGLPRTLAQVDFNSSLPKGARLQ